METLGGLVLTFLLNALWQVPLVALAAALADGLMRASPARWRHRLWVTALVLGLALPLLSLRQASVAPGGEALRAGSAASQPEAGAALWWGSNAITLGGPTRPAAGWSERLRDSLGKWNRRIAPVHLSPALTGWVLWAYFLSLAWCLLRLVRAWRQTMEIGRSARVCELPEWMKQVVAQCEAAFGLKKVPILVASPARAPLTLGIRHACIVIPEALFAPENEKDLTAALCHEMAHIRRRDYAANLIHELLNLPLAVHPAAAFIKRCTEETRELTCDEMVSGGVVSAQAYARSLVNLAKTLAPAAANSRARIGLGVFDSNILERRVMRILEVKPRNVRRSGILLAASLVILAAACAAGSLFGLRVAAASQNNQVETLDPFVGTWKGAFKGQDFITVKLLSDHGQWTGQVSAFEIGVDDHGNLTKAEPREGPPSQVIDAQLMGDSLEFRVRDAEDTSQMEMKLIGGNKALMRPADAPMAITPWEMTRVASGMEDGPKGGVPGGVKGGVVDGVMGGVPAGVAGATPRASQEAAEPKGQGTVTGTVFDPSGARVPKAIVSFSNQKTGAITSVSVNDVGEFTAKLPAGEYQMEAASTGFAIYHRQKFTLGPGNPNPDFPVILEPGDVFATVDVTAPAVPGSESSEASKRPHRIRVGGLVQATKLIKNVPPDYPEGARQRGVQGVVLLQAVISKKGEPLNLKVISSPDKELSDAAMEAVKQWRYESTLLNGEPIEVVTTIAVRFHLENGQ
jgi:TonB family protein